MTQFIKTIILILSIISFCGCSYTNSNITISDESLTLRKVSIFNEKNIVLSKKSIKKNIVK